MDVRCDIMTDIHGKCSHYYCEQCMISNKVVSTLKMGCNNWEKFNPDEYKEYAPKRSY